MVMLFEPIKKAVESLRARGELGTLIYLSPQGRPLKQDFVEDLASKGGPYTLLCGRYGGVDERIIQELVDLEISVGDYVVSGGELPAMVLMDAVARHVPGVLGHADSAKLESFSTGLLEAPLFTRPREIDGLPVPQPFVEGDHQKIDKLRQALAQIRTRLRRPDLLPKEDFDPKSVELVKALSDAELKSCGLSRAVLEELL
jgi:tRNA (guanine37-N1)-methyltransferase